MTTGAPVAAPDARLTALLEALVAGCATGDRPPLVAVCGAQGSGKTTLARAVARRIGAAQLSIDDVYLTRRERATLAEAVHPLFAVRGPPLTHDLGLLDDVIGRLQGAGGRGRTPLPAFDKLTDERRPHEDWPVFEGRPRAILIDGWLLGARPQDEADLATPVNALERMQDAQGVWRRTANAALAGPYAALFARFDATLFLRAPGFEAVLDWRCEQEAELLGAGSAALPPARRAELAVFVQHFERISRHMLAGGVRADRVVDLDHDRRPASPAAWPPAV